MLNPRPLHACRNAVDPGRVDMLDGHYLQVKRYQAELRADCHSCQVWWEETLLILLCAAIAALVSSRRC